MGAGNPKLKSFDNELFEPTTYFLDLSSSEPEESEDFFPEELSFEDLQESLIAELGLQAASGTHDELSYAFRDSGVLLLEGKLSYLITETSGERYHLPLAVIPNFRFDEIVERVESEQWGKQEWYTQRGLNWDRMVNELAAKEWDKRMEEFVKESHLIMSTILQWYPEKLSTRNGAWLSSGVTEAAPIAA